MNLRQFAFFVIVVALITACSDNENKDVNIVGTWKYVSSTISNCDNPDNNDVINYPDCSVETECVTITYNSDGSFLYIYATGGSSTEMEGTYSVSGSTLYFNGNEPEKLSRTSSTLTITSVLSDGCIETKLLEKQ